MSKITLPCLLILLLLMPVSALAQEDLPETLTTSGGWLTFNHPSGWVMDDHYPTIEGATTAEALTKDDSALLSSDFKFQFIDGIAIKDFLGYDPTASNAEIVDILTLLVVADSGEADPITFDPLVENENSAYITGADSDTEAVIGVLEVAEGRHVIFMGSSGIDGLDNYLPTLLAMVETLQYDVAAADATLVFANEGGTTATEPGPLAPEIGEVVWQQQRKVGFEEGDFGTFNDLAVGPDGLIYVADAYQNIKVFTAEGDYQQTVSNEAILNITDLTIAPDDTLWAVDQFTQTVYHLDTDGNLLASFGEAGAEDGQFGDFAPEAIEIGADGNLYILDSNLDASGVAVGRIQVWTTAGMFERSFPISFEGEYEFSDPTDMTFGADGNLYLADFAGVRVFDPTDGTLIEPDFAPGVTDQMAANGIAVAPDGTVALASHGTIYLIDAAGTKAIAQFGTAQAAATDGTGAGEIPSGEFYAISGIEFLPDGDLVVADTNYGFSQVVRVSVGE